MRRSVLKIGSTRGDLVRRANSGRIADYKIPLARSAAIARLAAEGWQIEADPRFGFAFIRRDGERRLLILTPRDPHDTRTQSFNPFKSGCFPTVS